MSNILARFYKATGNEFFDTAIKLDLEVWNFVRFEFKNKTKKEMEKATGATELPAGAIPYRYWESHGKPIHAAAWNVVKCVRQAYDIYPTDEAEVTEKRKWLQTAIGYCGHLDCKRSLRKMDEYFFELYGEKPVHKRKKKRRKYHR